MSEPVESGGDFVLCLAAHPRLVDDTDGVNVLVEGVTHDGKSPNGEADA
ncbi:hypothetical protein ACNS7O_07035 [Haloferacaceae archaeon DSL9]